MEHEERLKAALADRYSIEREIGRGGMATVYLAQDLKHHRQVAVKVLDPDLAQTLGAERFLREIETAAKLTHPHVLPLFDSGDADGFLFYVMPYIEGESLRERLVREHELPVPEAARLLRDVVDALAAAHKLGVVHRDIKPENVLISGRHAMVADFGVAKAVSEATGRHKLTTVGVALGTPSYMAPEQAAADETIDQRADIYAVGAMAYELLTGRPPFTGGTPQQILAAQVMESPQPVTELRASVPPALEALIMRCLEKKPADRWQSAEEMLPHLEAAATPSGGMTPTDMEPVARQAPSLRGGLGKWLAGAGALVVVAVVTTWGLMKGIRTEGEEPSRVEAESVADALNRLPGIAVLPFENRSGLPEDQYFTDGIQDELLTRLSRVPGLRVPARTSIEDYRDVERSVIPEIGRELRVDYVLEGSVQRAGDQVRIIAQLIDVGTEDHLWSEVFDREVSTETLFDVQSEIVHTIAAYLNIELREEERLRAAQRSTSDMAAYDLYLRGLFEEALERDPGFLAAHVGLAGRLSYEYQVEGMRSVERANTARSAAERAIALDPESEDAQLAMGLYWYRVEKDWDRALDWFSRASGTLVGDYEYHRYRGLVERRAGKWRDAAASFEAAATLSPRSSSAWIEVGVTYTRMQRYDKAEAALLQAQRLGGDAFRRLCELSWYRDGTTEGWRPYLEANPTNRWAWEVLMTDGRYEDALAYLNTQPDVLFGQFWWYPKALLKAETFEGLGQHVDAQQEFEAAVDVLEPLTREAPEDERYHAALARAYAGLGMHDEAIAEARRAVEIMPREKDAMNGPFNLFNLAGVHARLGEVDEALAVLEDLLSAPSKRPATLLEDHFRFRFIRDDPRFKTLMDRERNRVF